MPALNFSARFADAVANGEKRQTIRAHRKHPIRSYYRLYLYTGMRTKKCRQLGVAICQSVDKVEMGFNDTLPYMKINGKILSMSKIQEIAKADGFLSAADMFVWFDETHGLPFEGDLIKW